MSTTGASQPTACSAGTFQPNQGSYNCLDAEPGSYVSGPGAADDTPCALGTYQPQAGQTSCIAAPIGSYVDVTGARAATACPATTTTLGEGSTSATDCVSVGEVALTRVDQAVSTGGLVPADSGKGGTKAFEGWISDLGRSVDFLSGPQHQAGCVGVRNALAKADGRGSPKDAVTGPARAATADDLRWVLSENGCTGR